MAKEKPPKQIDYPTEIAKANSVINNAIADINRISRDDVRGETPEISEKIKELDEKRKKALKLRRELQQEYAVTTGVNKYLNRRGGREIAASLQRAAARVASKAEGEE